MSCSNCNWLRRRLERTEGAVITLRNSLQAQDMYIGGLNVRMDGMAGAIVDGRRALRVMRREYTHEIQTMVEQSEYNLEELKVHHAEEMDKVKKELASDKVEIEILHNKFNNLMGMFTSMQHQLQQVNSTNN